MYFCAWFLLDCDDPRTMNSRHRHNVPEIELGNVSCFDSDVFYDRQYTFDFACGHDKQFAFFFYRDSVSRWLMCFS